MKKLKKVVAVLCSAVMLCGGFGFAKVEAASSRYDYFDQKPLNQIFEEDEPEVLKATQYDLMIGNVRVTSDNMKDIPGVNGKASFDPKTSTLTLTNVTGIKTPYDRGNGETIGILSALDELNIVGTAKIANGETVGIWAPEGKVVVNANLTMKTYVSGIIANKLEVNGGKIDIQANGLDKVASKAYGIYAYDGDVASYLNLKNRLNKGVYVSKIVKNGPASFSDLKEGDLICTIDGKGLSTINDLREFIYSKKPGDEVQLEILRNDNKKNIGIILGKK